MDKQELEAARLSITKLLMVANQIQSLFTRTLETVACSGSQDEEDKILAELLSLSGGGVYVDVGAYWPEECSNTWQFYQAGWRGLLVEPLPNCWSQILTKRPGDTLWPKAAGSYNGLGRMRICQSTSSMSPDWNIKDNGEILVEVETLTTILNRFPEIRDDCKLCSIDVEGMEGDVLQGIDWNVFRPDVFVVEYLEYHPGGQGKDLSVAWGHYLTDNDYEEVWRTKCNVIYLRCDLVQAWKTKTSASAFR